MSDPVLCEVDRGVATVTLNRPERKNAWTGEMEHRYLRTLDALDRDPDVRAVVVTGSGDAFCPGLDFDVLAATGRDPDGLDPTRSIGPVLRLGLPLVAAINGACAGIGLVQALACDVRFAADGAKLATSFARRGTVAELATAWLLPRIVGHATALDLLLSGRTVLAGEAAALGLVHRVAAPGQLLDEAQAYARDLAAQCAPHAMAAIKRQVYDAWTGSFAASEEQAFRLLAEPGRMDDLAEGVAAYVERRPPSFRPYAPAPGTNGNSIAGQPAGKGSAR